MTAPAIATPNLLTDPGTLLWAPLGTSLPTHASTASKFSDSWPTGWLGLGATQEGSNFSYTSEVEPITVAEFFDPIRYATTERSGSFAFALADFTLTNLKRAMNGGVITTTGSGATSVNKWEPPDPGGEVRAMIGWESQDNTTRFIGYQCLNSGEIASAFQKAPAFAVIPFAWNFEIPAGGTKPFGFWTAGVSRA